jgi:hypothetical protein
VKPASPKLTVAYIEHPTLVDNVGGLPVLTAKLCHLIQSKFFNGLQLHF